MSGERIIEGLQNALEMAKEGRTVIFVRKEGWYPVTLTPKCKIEDHVRLNPGTIRVEDAKTGEVLFREQ